MAISPHQSRWGIQPLLVRNLGNIGEWVILMQMAQLLDLRGLGLHLNTNFCFMVLTDIINKDKGV